MKLKLIMGVTIALLVITIATMTTSCKKEKCHDPANPDCENYNPCLNQKPVKAEIELSQREELGVQIGDNTIYFEGQEIFRESQIRFHCPLNGAKYAWTLGAETITTQTFERQFFSVPFGEYFVKLVVEKAPNKSCFPADDGVDTFVKKFRIVPICSLAIYGIYKGKWDGVAGDSALITVRSFNSNLTDSCSKAATFFRFTNLQGKEDTLMTNAKVANNKLIIYDPGDLTIPSANFKLNTEDQTAVFDYTIGAIEKKYLFRGRKIAN